MQIVQRLLWKLALNQYLTMQMHYLSMKHLHTDNPSIYICQSTRDKSLLFYTYTVHDRSHKNPVYLAASLHDSCPRWRILICIICVSQSWQVYCIRWASPTSALLHKLPDCWLAGGVESGLHPLNPPHCCGLLCSGTLLCDSNFSRYLLRRKRKTKAEQWLWCAVGFAQIPCMFRVEMKAETRSVSYSLFTLSVEMKKNGEGENYCREDVSPCGVTLRDHCFPLINKSSIRRLDVCLRRLRCMCVKISSWSRTTCFRHVHDLFILRPPSHFLVALNAISPSLPQSLLVSGPHQPHDASLQSLVSSSTAPSCGSNVKKHFYTTSWWAFEHLLKPFFFFFFPSHSLQAVTAFFWWFMCTITIITLINWARPDFWIIIFVSSHNSCQSICLYFYNRKLKEDNNLIRVMS